MAKSRIQSGRSRLRSIPGTGSSRCRCRPISDRAPGAIADPLWLLCRQWQFLEFAGEDAGTPIEVRVEGEAAHCCRAICPALAGDGRGDTRARLLGGRAAARGGRRERAGAQRSPAPGRRGGLYLQRHLGTPALTRFATRSSPPIRSTRSQARMRARIRGQRNGRTLARPRARCAASCWPRSRRSATRPAS